MPLPPDGILAIGIAHSPPGTIPFPKSELRTNLSGAHLRGFRWILLGSVKGFGVTSRRPDECSRVRPWRPPYIILSILSALFTEPDCTLSSQHPICRYGVASVRGDQPGARAAYRPVSGASPFGPHTQNSVADELANHDFFVPHAVMQRSSHSPRRPGVRLILPAFFS